MEAPFLELKVCLEQKPAEENKRTGLDMKPKSRTVGKQ